MNALRQALKRYIRKHLADEQLLEEAADGLETAECKNPMLCTGPTLRPVAMGTCQRCASLAKIQKRLGKYSPRKNWVIYEK